MIFESQSLVNLENSPDNKNKTKHGFFQDIFSNAVNFSINIKPMLFEHVLTLKKSIEEC